MSIATYEEVLDLPNHPDKLLIDVRKIGELYQNGRIPFSIHMPLPFLKQDLSLSADEFQKKYGRPKPRLDQELIFHCAGGGRAQTAVDWATKLGYTNARNYKGSYNEWVAKKKQSKG